MSGGSQSAEPIALELLTTAEAARLCNVGERTLWRCSRCGIAPQPVKIGVGKTGAVRYRRDEYLAWIGAGCPRRDPGLKPNEHSVREMKGYGVLGASFELGRDPIDLYAVDAAYWRSLWHRPTPGVPAP